jgi:hypothetical protein
MLKEGSLLRLHLNNCCIIIDRHFTPAIIPNRSQEYIPCELPPIYYQFWPYLVVIEQNNRRSVQQHTIIPVFLGELL